MTQLYVMVPGNPQPQLFTVDELVAKIRTGELGPTVDTVRAGEATWAPAKDLPEVAAKLAEVPPAVAPAPPIAPIGALPHASLAGPTPPPYDPYASQAGPLPQTVYNASQPTAPTAGPGRVSGLLASVKKLRVSRGAVIGVGAALVVLIAGLVTLSWYRNSYTHGLVLEHLPDDCGTLIYVDLQGIAESDPAKPYVDKVFKNLRDLTGDEDRMSHKDKERMDNTFDALKHNGVDEWSFREAALCIRPTDDGKQGNMLENGVIVIGGTFRKGDPLGAIKESVESSSGKDDLCKYEDDDIKLLKCSLTKGDKGTPFYAALVDGRVLAISADRKLIKSLRNAKSVAKTYGADKGEQFVYHTSKEGISSYDSSWGDTKLKIGKVETVLTIDIVYDETKGAAKLAEVKADPDKFVSTRQDLLKAASKECVAEPFDDVFADAVDGAQVEALADGSRYTFKVANKDLTKLFKYLTDAEIRDLKKLIEMPSCIQRKVEPISPAAFGYDN